MRRPSRQRPADRPGFTLLEVVLAASITVLLMAALYVALNLQFRHAESGRNVVEQTTLAQTLIKRIADDINLQLPPVQTDNSKPVGGGGTRPGAGGGGATGTPAPPTTTPTTTTPTSTTPSSTSGGTGTSTTGGSSSTTSSDSTVTFNLGVQGTSERLTLYVSRVPREVLGTRTGTNPGVVSDLRRISYWLAGSEEHPVGLARQEIKVATSDEIDTMPPDVANPNSFVISGRVKSVTFSYYDGSGWTDSWDGDSTTSDSKSPMGPPMAIRIEMKIAPADANAARDPKNWKTYRHTVAIPTANRLTTQDEEQ